MEGDGSADDPGVEGKAPGVLFSVEAGGIWVLLVAIKRLCARFLFRQSQMTCIVDFIHGDAPQSQRRIYMIVTQCKEELTSHVLDKIVTAAFLRGASPVAEARCPGTGPGVRFGGACFGRPSYQVSCCLPTLNPHTPKRSPTPHSLVDTTIFTPCLQLHPSWHQFSSLPTGNPPTITASHTPSPQFPPSQTKPSTSPSSNGTSHPQSP